MIMHAQRRTRSRQRMQLRHVHVCGSAAAKLPQRACARSDNESYVLQHALETLLADQGLFNGAQLRRGIEQLPPEAFATKVRPADQQLHVFIGWPWHHHAYLGMHEIHVPLRRGIEQLTPEAFASKVPQHGQHPLADLGSPGVAPHADPGELYLDASNPCALSVKPHVC